MVLVVSSAACVREPRDWVCPYCGPGDVVLSELRGAQSGTDTYGEWVEIYNRTGSTLELAGLQLSLIKPDGTGEVRLTVRDPDAAVEAHGYFVLGRFPAGDEPAHVDYGYQGDYAGSLYEDGRIELSACGEVLDRVAYQDLPPQGSLAFDGALEPDAAGNDAEGSWCVDAAVPGDGGPTASAGVPGTPGVRNRPCI